MSDKMNNNENVLTELSGFLSSSREWFNKFFDLIYFQMKIVFIAYIALTIVGFLAIIYGLLTVFISKDITINIVVTSSGILIEFISQLLLRIYNRIVASYQDYSKNLFETQKFIYSTNLIDQVKEDKVRDTLIHKIFEYLTDWYSVTGLKGKLNQNKVTEDK